MKKLRIFFSTLLMVLLSVNFAFADVAFSPGVIVFMAFIRYGIPAIILIAAILLIRAILKNRKGNNGSREDDK